MNSCNPFCSVFRHRKEFELELDTPREMGFLRGVLRLCPSVRGIAVAAEVFEFGS